MSTCTTVEIIYPNNGGSETYTGVSGYEADGDVISFNGIAPGSDVPADWEITRAPGMKVKKT